MATDTRFEGAMVSTEKFGGIVDELNDLQAREDVEAIVDWDVVEAHQPRKAHLIVEYLPAGGA